MEINQSLELKDLKKERDLSKHEIKVAEGKKSSI